MLINEYPINDFSYQESVVKEVKEWTNRDDPGYDVTFNSEWSFWIPAVEGIIPQVGSIVRLYGRGIGYTVRGCFVDGSKVFYRTEEDDDKKNKLDILERQRKKKEDFEANKDDYFERISKLPLVFQERMQKFQRTNPDFDWKFGGYELFCCEQAVVMASCLKTDEAINKFYKKKYEDQREKCPEISMDHSGNTFEAALRLAYWYLTNPLNVVGEHGALTPLVGCKEYGCPH